MREALVKPLTLVQGPPGNKLSSAVSDYETAHDLLDCRHPDNVTNFMYFFVRFVQHGAQSWKCLRDQFGSRR